MPIKYSLSENNLITKSKVYKAMVHPVQNIGEDDIYERMTQAGTSLTKGDILACMQLYITTLEQYLREGCYVNTRHGNYRPGIKGKFSSPTDSFTSGKHRKHVSISASSTLEMSIQEAVIEKVAAELVAPQPTELFDSKSNTTNKTITPANMARLTGTRLQFDANESSEGIFFIANDDTETRVIDVLDSTNSKVNFLIPSTLNKGNYHLELRAAYTQNNEIRTGILANILTVK